MIIFNLKDCSGSGDLKYGFHFTTKLALGSLNQDGVIYIYIYVYCGVSVCKSLEKIIGDILLQGVDEGGVLI